MTVIRAGDRVRILRPRWVKRVGYPLVWTDLWNEVANDPRTVEAMRALDLPYLSRDLIRAIARARVQQRAFGGRQRSIHYYELPNDGRSILDGGPIPSHGYELPNDGRSILDGGPIPSHGYVGREVHVLSRRVCKTGTYFGAFDDEPGGLMECKTHVILTTTVGDIEVCDVELVA